MQLRLRAFALAPAIVLAACQGMLAPEEPPFDGSIVDAALAGMVADEEIAGGAVLVYRNGEEVYYGEVGYADRDTDKPWSRDTLAAIFSMTKPVTGVTLMSLYEDGAFELDDPVADYLPEYADVKVFEGLDEDGEMILVEPDRPIQVIDLLRHTSCYGYGWGNSPVDQLANRINPLDPRKPLAQMSEEIAQIPLLCHPGTEFHYGVSIDIQARLAEVIEGKPYEEVLSERVLDPLGLDDTGYFVEAERKDRVAFVYTPREEGGLIKADQSGVSSHWPQPPAQTNGGHGLISTIDDYMRFALMMQGEGTVDGVTILKPETVALMMSDQLPDDLQDRGILSDDYDFGINGGVRRVTSDGSGEGYGFVGEYRWSGAASTVFWVDPANDITVVYLTQLMPYSDTSHDIVERAVYEAAGLAQ